MARIRFKALVSAFLSTWSSALFLEPPLLRAPNFGLIDLPRAKLLASLVLRQVYCEYNSVQMYECRQRLEGNAVNKRAALFKWRICGNFIAFQNTLRYCLNALFLYNSLRNLNFIQEAVKDPLKVFEQGSRILFEQRTCRLQKS